MSLYILEAVDGWLVVFLLVLFGHERENKRRRQIRLFLTTWIKMWEMWQFERQGKVYLINHIG